jgi:predicted NBD/HSP70 family sugar kinase
MLVIGIDIGGTKIRGILWNGKRVIRAHEFPTPKNKKDFKKRILTLTASLAHQTPLCRIGIGAAGIVEKTTLISSPNIPYIKNFPFKILWPHSMGLRLDNDARCFARGEFLWGAARGARSLFALTIGTGVGRAYGKNGKIIKIKKLEYPEPWEREYQLIRNTRDDKALANFLAQKLSQLIRPFNPKVIVIGGGVMEHRSLLQKLRAALKARGLSARVCRSALGSNAVAIGAALLFD